MQPKVCLGSVKEFGSAGHGMTGNALVVSFTYDRK